MSASTTYTPGHNAAVTAFMARRAAETHAGFLLPHLRPDARIFDLGCGPGTITAGLAARVPQGSVLGLDMNPDQVAQARVLARERGLTNLEFVAGKIETAALPENAFDVVFAHAVFEHVGTPVEVLGNLRPLLRAGGLIALRSPEWGGFVLHPHQPAVAAAMAAYENLQRGNGGDLRAGRKLGAWLADAGFALRARSATYEIYEDPGLIAGYLADQLEAKGMAEAGAALRAWAREPHALFAQAWFEAIGVRP